MSPKEIDPRSDKTALSGWMRKLQAGEVLFQEGDVDRQLFILLEGKVEILKGKQRIHEVDREEAFLGELAALTGQPRSATVRTMVPTTLIVVPSVQELFTHEPTWALRLAQVLAIRQLRIESDLSGARQAATGADRDETVRILTGIIDSLTTGIDLDATVEL